MKTNSKYERKVTVAELKKLLAQVRAEYGNAADRVIGSEPTLTGGLGEIVEDFAELDDAARAAARDTFNVLLAQSPMQPKAPKIESPELDLNDADADPLRYKTWASENLIPLPPLDSLSDDPPQNIGEVCRRYIWVTNVERFIYRKDTQRQWKKSQFNSEFNKFSAKTKSIADDLFNEGNLLRKLPDIGYIPGSGEIVGATYNLWRPSPIVPVEGDTALWDAHMIWLFPDDDQRKRVLDWLAWVYQNQGERPGIALLVIGIPGTGKSAIARIFEQIIGLNNSQRPKNSSLKGDFNAWAAQCKLAIFEELYQSGRMDVVNAMHELITEARFEVNIKGVSAYLIRSYLACLGLSNHPDALPLAQFDRRWQVEQSPVTQAELKAFKQTEHFARIMPLLNALDTNPASPFAPGARRDGLRLAAAVAYQLKTRPISADDFTVGEAKGTAAKADMIELSRKQPEKWLAQLDLESREILNIRADLITPMPKDVAEACRGNAENRIEGYLKSNLNGVAIGKHRVKLYVKGKSSSLGLWAINALGTVAKRRIKAGSTPRGSVSAADIPAKYLAERVAWNADAEPERGSMAEARADFDDE